MKLLGSGGYSHVYYDKATNKVYGKTHDLIKLIQLANPTYYRFPKITASDNPKYNYMGTYYPYIFTEETAHKLIDVVCDESERMLVDELIELHTRLKHKNNGFYKETEIISNVKIRDSIRRMYYLLKRYDIEVTFDGMYNNLAVNKQGKVILLDIFFRKHQEWLD